VVSRAVRGKGGGGGGGKEDPQHSESSDGAKTLRNITLVQLRYYRADGIQGAQTMPRDTLQERDGNEHGVERLALKPRVPVLQ
jgi:hypothetical protein